MSEENNICPNCKEEIKVGAIKCKHCQSKLGNSTVDHGGNCPYCKEDIKKEAIKCKHCKSSLVSSTDCMCDSSEHDIARRRIPRLGFGRPPIFGADLEPTIECEFHCFIDRNGKEHCYSICF